jgi:periplasmic divalent cation tolerance protein
LQQNDKPVLVYSTFPTSKGAEDAGRLIVSERLAACVNILPGMVSLYRWQGAINRDQEVVMIIKTRASLAEKVIERVRALHPYEVPALLVLPTESGSRPFLDWIMSETEPCSG